MSTSIIRADARSLPLADASVDLVVTSPPYWGLRSYEDQGGHYHGQIGAEPTPGGYVASLLEVTRECIRVLKPEGSLWVNLGDKYATADHHNNLGADSQLNAGDAARAARTTANARVSRRDYGGLRHKSLVGLPWRYALACIDDLGLILRAEVIWAKPNGLPESVTDRVRRSHEQWFHLVKQQRYYSAVDEVREPHTGPIKERRNNSVDRYHPSMSAHINSAPNPLGKLPDSVWHIPTQPLKVPPELGVDHFAAFPLEFPRRIITGWSPAGICTECGEGRRPTTELDPEYAQLRAAAQGDREKGSGERARKGYNWGWGAGGDKSIQNRKGWAKTLITGYACGCPEPTAPVRPAVVLDPFGGTGTTALVAHAFGRHGISVDASADYCRIARWRTSDRGEIARAMGVAKPPTAAPDQAALFDPDAA